MTKIILDNFCALNGIDFDAITNIPTDDLWHYDGLEGSIVASELARLIFKRRFEYLALAGFKCALYRAFNRRDFLVSLTVEPLLRSMTGINNPPVINAFLFLADKPSAQMQYWERGKSGQGELVDAKKDRLLILPGDCLWQPKLKGDDDLHALHLIGFDDVLYAQTLYA